jgi:hypothetical protein
VKKRRRKAHRDAGEPEQPRRILKIDDPALREQLRAKGLLDPPGGREAWQRWLTEQKQRAEKNAERERALTEARRTIDRALKERSPAYQADRLIEALQRREEMRREQASERGRPPSARKRWALGKIRRLIKSARRFNSTTLRNAWETKYGPIAEQDLESYTRQFRRWIVEAKKGGQN